MDKWTRPLLGILLFALLLCGCIPTLDEDAATLGEAIQLYYAVGSDVVGGAAVDSELYYIQDSEHAIQEALDCLLAGPQEGSQLTSPFPENLQLVSWTLTDGTLYLEFDAAYDSLTGVALTLADYCLTLTLCQLEGVESVTVLAGRSELVTKQIQDMTQEDVLLSGAEEEAVYLNMVLWFPNNALNGLSVETRALALSQKDNVALILIDALLEGSLYDQRLAVAPEGTTLLSISMEGTTCTIDFSEEFRADMSNSNQCLLQMYAIVNTLCGSEYVTIERVYFYVEGELLMTYGGVGTSNGVTPLYELEKS